MSAMDKQSIVSLISPACDWRDSLLWFDTVDSTNTRAKALASQGAPHGTVLIADQQTGGRGRRGRSFYSPAGTGIYLTAILRPCCAPSELMHLTCAVGVAMCNAVEASCGFRPGIKWTNDLVFDRRKLSGILVELHTDSQQRVDYAVIGIGINCHQKPDDFPEDIRTVAGSLDSVSGREIHRNQLAAAMVESLWRMDCRLIGEKDQILAQYRRDCITLGQTVSITDAAGRTRHARAVDVDAEGALVVELPSGMREAVNSGEVSVRGMYGYT